MIRINTILQTAALGLITSAFAGQHQLKYQVTPIAVGTADGINDKGDVVGTLDLGPIPDYPSADNKHAFLYKKGKITDLGVFVDPSTPPYRTFGNAVNNSDVVVGNIIDHGLGTSKGRLDAFLWRNGQLIDIAQGTTDGGAQATATGINNRGDVVGSYDAASFLNLGLGFGISHAYLYRNNLLTDIGTLGGWFSFGLDINNAGQAIGTSTETPGFLSHDFKAFLYSNGQMRAIGGAQSASFTPEAINDHGWITGTLSGNVVLYINGRFINLGTGEGISLNNSGVVVGYSVGGTFVYDGRIHNLNDLVDGSWQITAVGHINDAGQIAATGVKPGSTLTYALLLNPEAGRGEIGKIQTK